MPITLMSFAVAPISGKFAEQLGVRWFLAGGLALVGIGLLLMRGVDPGDDWTALLAGFLVAGGGIGLTNPALATAAIGVVEPRRSGMASGINSTFRQVGIATGIAAWGAIFQHVVADEFNRRAPVAVADAADAVAFGVVDPPGRARPPGSPSRPSSPAWTASCCSPRSSPSPAPCSRACSSGPATSWRTGLERALQERGHARLVLLRPRRQARGVAGLGDLVQLRRRPGRVEVGAVGRDLVRVAAGGDQQHRARGDPRHQVDQRRRRLLAAMTRGA